MPSRLRSGCRRNRNPYCVWLRPDRFAAGQIQSVHCDLQLLTVNLNQQVMVIYLLALKRIIGRALDGIGVSSTPSGNKIGDALVFMAFVVVHVSGEDHNAEASVSLALLKHPGQYLLRRPSRVPAAELHRV